MNCESLGTSADYDWETVAPLIVNEILSERIRSAVFFSSTLICYDECLIYHYNNLRRMLGKKVHTYMNTVIAAQLTEKRMNNNENEKKTHQLITYTRPDRRKTAGKK